MSNNDNAVTAVTDDMLDEELNALIGDATDIDASETVASIETIEGETEASNEEIDLEEIEAAAVAEETKKAAYAEQTTEEEPSNITPISAATPASSKTSRAPRASRAAGAKSSAVLASLMGEEALLKAAMLVETDEESVELVDQLNTAIDSLAKKAGDKAVNLLRHVAEPRKLQNYTRLGMELLSKNRQVTSADLVKHLQGQGYTAGTARSQSSQLMSLLPALKVADRSGKALVAREDSTLLKSFAAATA